MWWLPWSWFLHVDSATLAPLAARPFFGEPFWGLMAILGLYFTGIGPLRQRLAPGARFPWRQATLFTSGIAVLLLALENYYLDEVGEKYLFCLHMLQHTLIIFAAPPLLMTGTPGWLLRPFTRMLGVGPLLRLVTRPAIAFVLFNIIFNVWHLAGLFEWALRDRQVHFFEHATFLLGGILMWWPILSPLPEYPRLGPGSQIVYYFLLSLSQVPLFFFLAFANTVYYDTYINAPRWWNLTPLQDQQVGGILMKIVGEVAFLSGIGYAFIRWYHSESRAAPVAEPSLN